MVFLSLLLIACNKDEAKTDRTTTCTNILDEWEITTNTYTAGIQRQNDLFFPSNDIGYSVGNAGTIMKTINGGDAWKVLEYYYLPEVGINAHSLTKAILYTTYFVDESVGFIGGAGEISYINNTSTGAVLLNTVDGGNQWNKRYLDNVRKINDLIFFDKFKGLGLFTVLNSNYDSELKLFSTEDGGENWNEVILPIDKIVLYNFIAAPTNIMIVGKDGNDKGVLLVTENTGLSWDLKNFPESGCNRLYFIDDQNGFASCGVLFLPENKYQTRDGGNSWVQIESPINISSLIHFNTVEKGFVINPVIEYIEGGGELTPQLQFYEVFQTTDGGLNWNKTKIDKECDLMGVSYAASKNTFYSIGNTANKFQVK